MNMMGEISGLFCVYVAYSFIHGETKARKELFYLILHIF